MKPSNGTAQDAPAHGAKYSFGLKVQSGKVQASSHSTFHEVKQRFKKGGLIPMARSAFLALEKKQRNEKKAVAYYTPACFRESPSLRRLEFAVHCNLIFIDVDNSYEAASLMDEDQLRSLLGDFNFFVYETASSTPEEPRLRVVVEAENISVADYPRAVEAIGALLGIKPNVESKTAVQPFYLPPIFTDESGVSLLAEWDNGRPFTVADIQEQPSEEPHPENNGSGGIEHLSPRANVTLEDARKALSYLDADCSYLEWIEIAAAIKHQFGPEQNEEGYELFDEWSSKGSRYGGPDETRGKWGSLSQTPKGRAPITIRTLLHRARAAGWTGGNGQTDAPPSALPLLGLRQILAYVPDPKEEIWTGGIFSAGLPSGIIGAPGVGKSRVALQAAICTILGWKFLGWETRGKGLKWLFLQTENSTGRLKEDLSAMTRHLSEEQRGEIDASLRILNISEMDFATICMAEGHPDKARILDTLEKEWPADIVVIDPLRDAGRGDLNKDVDMTETCQGITATIRRSNPRRAVLVIHHGRTGASEASKVFGDDAASFGRNSKVLYGWLRSQINIAAAGVEWPDVVIVGCGKNSNGPKWEPFAAQLQPETMLYRRLEPHEFDLNQWADDMANAKRKKAKLPFPEQIAEIVEKAGGEVRGGTNAENGLVQRVKREFSITRDNAIKAVEEAMKSAIDKREETPPRGGPAVPLYTLKKA